jgi:hypothetical protein
MGLLSIPRTAFRSSEAGDDFFKRADFFHPLEIRERIAFVESRRDWGENVLYYIFLEQVYLSLGFLAEPD